MNRTIEQLTESFDHVQTQFDGRIETADYASRIRSGSEQDAAALLRESPQRNGFAELRLSSQDIYRHKQLLLGRIVLLASGQALAPAVITEDTGSLAITKLNQPFDPHAPLDGIQFALSVKAQTRADGFGGHRSAGGFEQGHFATVLAAASASGEGIAHGIRQAGDTATHQVLQAGVPETMRQLDILPLDLQTRTLDPANTHPLPLFWHPSLETETGVLAGDYPKATELMLVAGAQAIGTAGIDRARRLVDEAVRGA